MTIYSASDHGGFELKEKIEFAYDVQSPQENAPRDAHIVNVVDMGPASVQPEDDYPDFAFELTSKLLTLPGFWQQTDVGNVMSFTEEVVGLLICRSGNGMAIAANKTKGVRAALCFTPEHAVKARQHNFANVLVLDADYSSAAQQLAVVDAFIHTQPELGGRHQRRVGKISAFEKKWLK